ncbi:MAG: apolipoprotein N-acyltransferase [Flavobacteriia bacterium]
MFNRITTGFLLSILSGLLFYIGWPTNGLFPLLFIGLTPLLLAFHYLANSDIKRKGIMWFSFLFIAHASWIGLSSNWFYDSSPKSYFIGVLFESIAYSVLLSPMLFINKRLGRKWSLIYFLAGHMTIELVNQYLVLSTPFFSLGSGLGMFPKIIQSYEIIGIEGGSFFILTANLGCYLALEKILSKQKPGKSLALISLGISPFVLSIFMSFNPDNKKTTIAALHTFQDTYNRRTHFNPEEIVNKLCEKSKLNSFSKTELLAWPETIISNVGWMNNLSGENSYKSMLLKLKNTNELSVCFGGFGFSLDPEGQNNPYSRLEKARNFYYRTHNVAVTINKDGLYSLRGKEIFVPFQERIPFLETLPVMEEFADVVGTNTMVSGYENSRTVHKTMLGKKFVPVLCYESIFPLKMAEFASESDFLVVLANEFWNKNLNGSEQYLCSNVAMAIQSRTAILRSSNSGISAIIDQDGKILVRKKGRNAGIIHASISKKQDFTFYELIAGIFYKISLIVYLGLLLITIFRSVTKTKST